MNQMQRTAPGCICFYEVMPMSRMISRKTFQDGFFLIAIILMLLGLMLYPSESVQAAKNGVELCLNVITPSLFPFFVLSTLCVDLGLIRGLGRLMEKFMVPLFRVGGACAGAFVLGIVGGYPVGARTAISLYQKGQCSKVEAERLLSFCNNSGPAFILGVVGAGIFSSSSVGLWLYCAHVAASIIVGIVFRFYSGGKLHANPSAGRFQQKTTFAEAFTSAVKNAFQATMNICAFVIFFTVVIRLLFLAGIITYVSHFLSWILKDMNLQPEIVESILTGLIEMTSGVWSLRDIAASMSSRLCMAAFILGWAGLSVHCQVLSFIGSSGLSTRTYFLGKLLHGMVSAVLIFILSRILDWDAPVSRYLANEVSTIAGLDFHQAFSVSMITAGLIWLILTIFICISCEKSMEKRKTIMYNKGK